MQVVLFHSLAFCVGYFMTHSSVSGPDRVPVARCISLETGMQVQLPPPASPACMQSWGMFHSAMIMLLVSGP